MADTPPSPPPTIRTFRQNGQGYSSTPVTIVAKIDGVKIFEGEVPTLDEPYPALPQPNVEFGVPMFTWEEPLDKTSGQMALEITVTNGLLLVADTYSNASKATPPPPATPTGTAQSQYVDENAFEDLTWWQYINQVWHVDAFTNVVIDGVAQSRPTAGYSSDVPVGQWYWQVDTGSVFTCNINIQIPPIKQPVGAPA